MAFKKDVPIGVALLGLFLGLVVGGAAVAISSGLLTSAKGTSSTSSQPQAAVSASTSGLSSSATSITDSATSTLAVNRTITVSETSNTAVMHLQASQLLYSGGSTVTIFGTLNPQPALSTGVQVTTRNPQGIVVDIGEALIGSTTGTFLYSLPSGSSANWIQGAYSINATGDSGSATTIFYYNPSQTTQSGTRLNLQVLAPSAASPGQLVYVAILLTLPNGDLDDATSWSVLAVLFPDGTLHDICASTGASSGCTGSLSRIHTGFYQVTFTLPTNAQRGTYFAEAGAVDSAGNSARALGQFGIP